MRHAPRLSAPLSGAVLTMASTAFALMGTASGAAAAPVRTVEYSVTGRWAGDRQDAVTVTNGGPAPNGRSPGFGFPSGRSVRQGRDGGAPQSGADGTVVNESRNGTLAPTAARVPLLAGETGEHTRGHGFVDRAMKWFDGRDLSYPGRTRNTRNTWNRAPGPALISSYDGTPTAFGIGLRDHLRALTP